MLTKQAGSGGHCQKTDAYKASGVIRLLVEGLLYDRPSQSIVHHHPGWFGRRFELVQQHIIDSDRECYWMGLRIAYDLAGTTPWVCDDDAAVAE